MLDFAGFDWDVGNESKVEKHGVIHAEIEALLRNPGVEVFLDDLHSEQEERFRVVGRSASGRFCFVVFTRRERNGKVLVRVISARYMHTKEYAAYEQAAPPYVRE